MREKNFRRRKNGREDLDARLVARHPSPFDLQYADDFEVDDEIFGDKLIGSGYYY